MLLHAKINEIPTGEILQLIATDPATLRDVPKFCHFLQVQLLEQQTSEDGNYYYWLQKTTG